MVIIVVVLMQQPRVGSDRPLFIVQALLNGCWCAVGLRATKRRRARSGIKRKLANMRRTKRGRSMQAGRSTRVANRNVAPKSAEQTSLQFVWLVLRFVGLVRIATVSG